MEIQHFVTVYVRHLNRRLQVQYCDIRRYKTHFESCFFFLIYLPLTNSEPLINITNHMYDVSRTRNHKYIKCVCSKRFIQLFVRVIFTVCCLFPLSCILILYTHFRWLYIFIFAGTYQGFTYVHNKICMMMNTERRRFFFYFKIWVNVEESFFSSLPYSFINLCFA